MAETYAELKARLEVLREQMKTAFQSAFAEGSVEVFKSHPAIRLFSWTQYTPFFNDGDTCVFAANTDYPEVVFDINGEEQVMDSCYSLEDGQAGADIMTAGYAAVVEFLSAFNSDDFHDAFDDHVEVFVRFSDGKASVEVEEYEHE